MIKPADMMKALKEALQKQFPGEQIYENLTPRNFDRPSNLITLDTVRIGDIKNRTITLLYTYKITDFVSVDGHHNSDMPLLDLRTVLIVLGVFGRGFFTINGKSVYVADVSTKHYFDFTETNAVLSVTEDRSEFTPDETLPMMEQLNLKEAMQ